MGLFDTVICDYPLPLPDFTDEEFEDINSSDKGVSSLMLELLLWSLKISKDQLW